MRYSQSQIRSLFGLSAETFRYWKSVLPPLRSKAGKAPAFRVGDALALAVINSLVRDCKIDVGMLAPLADELFKACERPVLYSTHPSYMTINLRTQKIETGVDLSTASIDSCVSLIPMDLLWEEVKTGLIDEITGAQGELPLPLSVIAPAATKHVIRK